MTRILGGISWVAGCYQMYKQFKIVTSSAVDRGLFIYIRMQLCLFLAVVQWASHFITGAWASSTICAVLSHFSHVQLFVTLWTVDCQAPLSMGFSRQEYPSGLAFPPQGCLPMYPRDRTPCLLCLLHWQVGSLPLAPPGNSKCKTSFFSHGESVPA